MTLGADDLGWSEHVTTDVVAVVCPANIQLYLSPLMSSSRLFTPGLVERTPQSRYTFITVFIKNFFEIDFKFSAGF